MGLGLAFRGFALRGSRMYQMPGLAPISSIGFERLVARRADIVGLLAIDCCRILRREARL